MTKQHLAFLLMDAPYEQARTTTGFRLVDLALKRGHDVTVFCYEGAVSLAFAKQMLLHGSPNRKTICTSDLRGCKRKCRSWTRVRTR